MTNPKVDWYFEKEEKWKAEITSLRTIVLGLGLTEVLKWGCPCYAQEGNNVVLIHVFKDYCALLLFKGALLKDPDAILIQQTKNVQATRQLRFTSLKQVIEMEATIKAYIHEAMAVEKAGLKVSMKPTTEFTMVQEFQDALDEDPALKQAFYQLTPGRQRAYLLHFESAKLAKTRQARIDKYTPKILSGSGLDD